MKKAPDGFRGFLERIPSGREGINTKLKERNYVYNTYLYTRKNHK